MTPQEELAALRRLAELEAKASGGTYTPPTAAPEVPAVPKAPEASFGDRVAGTALARGLYGAASPVIGAFQAGVNAGDWIAEKLGLDPTLGKLVADTIGNYEASQKRGMVAANPGNPDPVNLAGLAGTLVSGGLATRGITAATSYAGKVAQGAALGAGFGAAAPSSEAGQTVNQALLGGALGGGIPAVAPVVSKVAKSAYGLVEPALDPAAIKSRAYMTAAGDKAAEIAQRLRQSQPVVAGSMPTAGEAAAGAGRAEFSALQESAAKVLPTNYLARNDARNAARLNQLDLNVAGTPGAMDAATDLRATTAKQNYGTAMQAGIDPDMAPQLKQQIKLLLERPSMKEARHEAIRLAKEKNLRFAKMGQLEALDWMKKGLDEQISAAAKAGSSAGKEKLAALMQTKQDFTTVLEELAPAYKVARETYAKQSVPINQMNVGQYLRDKLVPATGDDAAQSLQSFSGALRDAPGTLKRSLTNAPRYEKLSDVLSPQQIKVVESIRKDLANVARHEMMARKGAQAGPSALDAASESVTSATGGGRIPNPLNRVVTVANAILSRLEGKVDRKLAIEIAAEMLEPQQVAKALEKGIVKEAAKKPAVQTVNALRPAATAGIANALAGE